MLSEDDHVPLMNKVLQGLYPPGSTVKPMNALALLQLGIDPHASVNCSGAMQVGNGVFHCHKRGGHGSQNMRDALKNSCDVYFYQTALRIGPDQIAKTAHAFGLGEIFDIGIPGQKKGIVGSTEWKRKAVKREPQWQPGDSVSYGIGQGYVNVNALQLAVMTARLANGRTALNPRLVKSVGDSEMPRGSAAPALELRRSAFW